MYFSEVLSSIAADGTSSSVTVGEDWLQGRGMYGGLIAGVGNEVMRRLVPADRPLRSLQTTFVGPATAGTWRIDARILRVGRAVTVARCDILDGDQIAATLTGVYGLARPSAISIKPASSAAPRSVDEINEVRFLPDRIPPFVQHFAIRWSKGAKPFSGTRSASIAFIRHRDPAPTTESHIVALVDCIPPSAVSMMTAPAPFSSLVWTLELFEHDYGFAPDAWWRIDTDIDAATEGYVNQTGLLYDPNGRPVALSRQLVAVFG